jgi:chromosome segregation ATPase
MPDLPVPVRLVMKNFCSHVNNVVEFGAPYEKVFVRGETGQGKSQIFNAIKFALGKEKNSDEEVFTYDEVEENGEKKKIYKNECQIILTLKNSGQNPMNQFPKDAEFSIEVKFVKDKRTQYYLIRPDGTRSVISREEISHFAKHDDPLLFIDQAQTSIWTQMTGEERFKRLAGLIGIEAHRQKVKETYEKLRESDHQLEIHTQKLELEKQKFSEIEQKYNRFLEKERIRGDLVVVNREFEIKAFWDLYDEYKNREAALVDIYNQMFDMEEKQKTLALEIEKLKIELAGYDDTFKQLSEQLQNVESQKSDLQFEIREFEKELELFRRKIEESYVNIADYPTSSLPELASTAQKRLDEINGQIAVSIQEFRDLNEQLSNLKRDQPSLPRDCMILSKELASRGIAHEFVYEVLDIAPGKEEWRDILESVLSENKKAIMVEPKDRLEAEWINRSRNLEAILLSPRKESPREPRTYRPFKMWEDILTITSNKIRENTVKNILDYLLGNVYFADTPEEKEQILNSSRGTVLCLDNYKYDSCSQRRIHKPREYLIGKNAKKLEQNRIEQKIQALESEISRLQQDKKTVEKNLQLYRNLQSYNELYNKIPDIEQKKTSLEAIKKQYDELTVKMANPKDHRARLERRLEDNKETYRKNEEALNIRRTEYAQIQKDITSIVEEFSSKLGSFKANIDSFKEFINASLREIDLEPLFPMINDERISYRGIKDSISSIKELFKIPNQDQQELRSKINYLNGRLAGYADISNNVPRLFEAAKSNLSTLEQELNNYEATFRRCDEQHQEAKNELNDKLFKWQRDVNRNFSRIMQMLELDGELKFDQVDEEGRYCLHFNVANSVGGAKSILEKSNLSGGEKQRTNIAFIIAIVLQTQYTYLIWDEPDANIGDPYREKLSNVIREFFSNRKLIFASPQRIVKGYVKVFDQIIEVFKDQTNHSRISKVRITEEFKRERGVLGVKTP